jgi:hypothetical protein
MAIGYPTVPLGKARIRVMNSAAHTRGSGEALDIFARVGALRYFCRFVTFIENYQGDLGKCAP